MSNPQFYVSKYKRCYGTYDKVKKSLRSKHFGTDYEKALAFFDSLDSSIYRVILKKYEDGETTILRIK